MLTNPANNPQMWGVGVHGNYFCPAARSEDKRLYSQAINKATGMFFEPLCFLQNRAFTNLQFCFKIYIGRNLPQKKEGLQRKNKQKAIITEDLR